MLRATRRLYRARTWIGLAMLAAAFVATGTASAEPKLYHSPGSTGADPATTPISPLGSSETFYLFLDPGPVATSNGGTLCNRGSGTGGDGDETCGVHFELSVSGDLTILDFSAEVGVAEKSMAPGMLKVALLTTASPLPAAPTRIGTVEVDTSGPLGGTGQLVMLRTVDADLDLRQGAPRELFQVPEPGFLALLLPGLALLVALVRVRAKRVPA